MKTYTLIAILSTIGMTLFAQLNLETTINESAGICHMESTGEVYYSMDVVNKQCHIYRMDHSLYKTISLPTPQSYFLSDLQYVSEKLFNNDDLVELVYIYSKYVPTTDSYYYLYETKVINENGDILLQVPGGGHSEVIEVPNVGKKFLVYEYDYSLIPFRTKTRVYSLPDSTVQTKAASVQTMEMGDPFPNPTSRQISIPVVLPDGSQTGILELFDMNGQRKLSYPISGSDQQIILPTHGLVPGTYVYHVSSRMFRSSAKKVIVRH